MSYTVWRPDGSSYEQNRASVEDRNRAPYRVSLWKANGSRPLLAIGMSLDEARRIVAEHRPRLLPGERVVVTNAADRPVLASDD